MSTFLKPIELESTYQDITPVSRIKITKRFNRMNNFSEMRLKERFLLKSPKKNQESLDQRVKKYFNIFSSQREKFNISKAIR